MHENKDMSFNKFKCGAISENYSNLTSENTVTNINVAITTNGIVAAVQRL